MKGAKYEMPGFRGAEADLHCFPVTHLTDKYDLGGLSQRGTKSARKADKVNTKFPLIERGSLVCVSVFNRIFKGDDMNGPIFVYLVQDSCQRRGFACPRGTGKQDKSTLLLGYFGNYLGEV